VTRHSVDDAAAMDRYGKLGDEPIRITIAANDAAHRADGAHTEERHGPDIPLRRRSGGRTIEGRIHGDPPWTRRAKWSTRWTDSLSMNRVLNDYLRENWEIIRRDLAIDGEHGGGFDTGEQIGEGFFNNGTAEAEYATTSHVRVFLQVVPGSDPLVPFIVTAYPAGLM
jgi:hypothetical protein